MNFERLAFIHRRSPFRRLRDDPDGLMVQLMTDTFLDLDISDSTRRIHRESKRHSAFGFVKSGQFRVSQLRVDPLREFVCTSPSNIGLESSQPVGNMNSFIRSWS